MLLKNYDIPQVVNANSCFGSDDGLAKLPLKCIYVQLHTADNSLGWDIYNTLSDQ